MNPDSVHYKIFLCAAGYEPEIRRITIDKDICHNYFYLKQKILAIFPTLKDVAFTISWKDSEGDNIRICTDDELVIALKEMESHDFKKIYVNATPQGKEGPVHPDVICDGCEHPLHGFRYKCLVCYDFDLCPDCERSQLHPDHPMIRIPLPLSSEMPFGRRFARDIAKMGKHLERLLHPTTDHLGDKKAKGDYSSASKSGINDNKKQHKMKFCPHNDVQNFLHNLVYSQLEKMRNSSCGDNNAASNNTSNDPQQDNSQPQASSSNDCYPIFEEQKKFVNILTNGLNSFLDPLGIDIVVEEDPVKEENPHKHPQSKQSENDSGANHSSVDGGTSSSQAAPSFTPSPIVNQPGTTRIQPASLITEPILPLPVFGINTECNNGSTNPNSDVYTPVAVASSSLTQAQASTITGVQPSPLTNGVPPPASMMVSQPSSTIGFQLPASIGVPPPVTVKLPQPVMYGVQPPPHMTIGAQALPATTAAPVLTPVNYSPTPPQVVSPTHLPNYEIPVLDSSWTIVNDGMGESMILQGPSPPVPEASATALPQTERPLHSPPAPVGVTAVPQTEGPRHSPPTPLGATALSQAERPRHSPPAPLGATALSQTERPLHSPPAPLGATALQQDTAKTERIYPQLTTPVQLSTEEALKIMVQLGFKNEEWLQQLIENKKGNIQEVLNFLSPIPKPKPSTNILP